GRTIKNIKMHYPEEGNIGFFGVTNGAKIKDVQFTNVDIKGDSYVGGLVGEARNSKIDRSDVTGIVEGSSSVGILLGRATNNSKIEQSYATGEVKGNTIVGGLIGIT